MCFVFCVLCSNPDTTFTPSQLNQYPNVLSKVIEITTMTHVEVPHPGVDLPGGGVAAALRLHHKDSALSLSAAYCISCRRAPDTD